jgi:hypothetical protein
MRFPHFYTAVALAALALPFSVIASSADNVDKDKTVAEATGGRFKTTKGKYFDKDCNDNLDYEAEVIDLNRDGRPEVFVSIQGTCLGGATGVHMNLYIKNPKGQWKPQFGFPGVYKVLTTRSKGYPDIEIGGPGFCFPVWRWNGALYAIYKKCR